MRGEVMDLDRTAYGKPRKIYEAPERSDFKAYQRQFLINPTLLGRIRVLGSVYEEPSELEHPGLERFPVNQPIIQQADRPWTKN